MNVRPRLSRVWTATLLVASALGTPPRAGAQEVAVADSGSDDAAEMERLLQILEEETEVATRTRMNSDFVPGIVTVLQGDEMEALGFETVWEALEMVPGMQVARDLSGAPSLIMRGLQFPFNSGNVKVLIDGLSLSREDAGVNGIALDTPIALVERIEVIRGPGSVVHGDFAFMGLVNIVTRSRSRAFARGTTDEAWSGGGVVRFGEDSGWHGSLAAAGLTTDQALVVKPRTGEEQRLWAVADVGVAGFSVHAAFASRDVDEAAPPPGGPTIGSFQRHGSVEARWEAALGPDLKAIAHADYRRNRFELSDVELEGWVGGGGVALQWQGWRRHAWLLDVGWTGSHIDRARFRPLDASPPSSPPQSGPVPGAPPLPGSGTLGVDLEDEGRTILSATLQDAFDLSEDLTLTAGGRLDHYDDLGTRLTPRAALVWRVSAEHVLKLQYAEGFRPPTFFELFGRNDRSPRAQRNANLDFEINRTAELHYVLRKPGRVIRATAFRTNLDAMIFPRMGFRNGDEARATGFELEWQQQIGSRLKTSADLSFVDAQDSRNQAAELQRSPASAEWLGNLAVSWRMTRQAALTARWSHVGDRIAPEFPGYDLVDLTLSRRDLLLRGLQLRLGVKNLFDDDVVYPQVLPERNLPLRFPGRSVWVQLSWSR